MKTTKTNGNGKHAWLGSWMRRVVPAGYAEATLVLTGTSPLLMKTGDFDPDSALYRSFYLAGQKRQKSLDDQSRLREMEWQLSLYWTEELGPVIPGKNVKELLRDSATKWRKGEEVKRSLIVIDSLLPLEYDGPRSKDELWAAGFRHMTMVANGGASRGRVQRCRPCFAEWKLTAALAYDPEDLDFDFLGLVVERSQKFGFCDGRAIGFGAFTGELTAGPLHKEGVRSQGQNPPQLLEQLAHDAAVARIMLETPVS